MIMENEFVSDISPLSASEVVIAHLAYSDGTAETRIQYKTHIFDTLDDDVVSIAIPMVLHNAN
jgi:hypothetical protein